MYYNKHVSKQYAPKADVVKLLGHNIILNPFRVSERKVVVAASEILRLGRKRCSTGHLLNGRNRLAVGGSCRLGAPGAYVGIPALVELAAFDVEADLYEIADIEGVLINAVAEEVESYLFGVGIGGLEHIYFLFPGVSGF